MKPLLDRVPSKTRSLGQNYFDNQYKKQAEILGFYQQKQVNKGVQWIFDDPEDLTNEEGKSGSSSFSQSRDFVDIVKRQTQVYELRKQINSGSDTTD